MEPAPEAPVIHRPIPKKPTHVFDVTDKRRFLPQEQILVMPLKEILRHANTVWVHQRRLLFSTGLLTPDYQRGPIKRSLLCEFFAKEGVLMKMSSTNLNSLPAAMKRTSLRLMEMTTWKLAVYWINFHDIAVEELHWGQALERKNPGIFKSGWFDSKQDLPNTAEAPPRSYFNHSPNSPSQIYKKPNQENVVTEIEDESTASRVESQIIHW